ncbi:MAG TPA: FtsX-like permease family protein [Kofleriaceae bacterium]|nr:FtsX-like permease family protein [Kofleriaceae bacterium]
MKSRFQTFVALRYLLADPPHLSKLALGMAAVAFVKYAVWLAVISLFMTAPDPKALLDKSTPGYGDYVMTANITLGVGCFWLYVAGVRALFTFYSTVSIVGVSIGAAALVLVLSIMNGFESDLRSKILGSNAHIQIAKEEGEFTEWQDIRARVDKVPGVVASTPFATSEVVIAANSNYFNVIVKGIDVASAVEVTNLEKALKDPDGIDYGNALERLAPLISDDGEVLEPAPPTTPPDPDNPVVDPAPPDMPGAAEPVDFSGDGTDTGSDVEPAPLDPAADPDFGGPDARAVLLDRPEGTDVEPPSDPAPDDFAEGEPVVAGEPTDFSKSRNSARTTRSSGQRIATLPGVLVGKELVKQIHCYTDQEVRLVSPLADPMNPDATGTPIPYNRDYRVAGQFFTGMYEYDLKLVYVSLESLQQFLRMGDAVDGIEVRIHHPDAVDTVVARIQRELGPNYRVQGWRELNRNLFSALKLEKIAMFMVLAIIILVASFSIVGNLIMTVVEKGREIALIKTLGASDVGIIGVFMLQGLFIGIIGTSLGVAVGLVGAWRLAVDGFPINPDVYYINKLPVEIDFFTVALVYGAGLVISIAATIYPAVVAAQLRPAAGLKQ